MKGFRNSHKGFTLVEIMIVVVIIGLLAAMAIPAFQKVRRSSIEKTVINDGRQLGAAAQQYMMEMGTTSVATSVLVNTSTTGTQIGYLKSFSKGVSYGLPATMLIDSTYTLLHSEVTIEFGPEGNRTLSVTYR